ncbi:MAG: hypothetical protein ACRD2G_11100 [Terriglobia bacterium]
MGAMLVCDAPIIVYDTAIGGTKIAPSFDFVNGLPQLPVLDP